MKKDHILVIRFSALGDVAMTVPVVYALAKTYPDLRITVLSRGFAKAFYENLAPNVSFMEADLKNEYKGVKGLNALYRRLAAKHFTAVADLHSVLRSDYLRLRFNFSRYKVAHIEKYRKGRRELTSINHKLLVQQPTSFKKYADVFSKLGYPINPQFESIFPPEGGDISSLPAVIGQKKDGERWIGIAPFAAHEGKIYPLDLMKQVVDQLLEQHPGSRVFLFGRGKKEDETFAAWCDDKKECVNVAKHIDGMREELILMSHLDLRVSMDSANMHLASLTGTPVVSVWGATHPYAGFMGWNQSVDNAVQVEHPCRPCSIYGNKKCHRGDYACLNDIKPQQIIEKINNILK